MTTETAVAPSATPGTVSPALPTAPASPAPVAASPTQPTKPLTTLADFDAYASAALLASAAAASQSPAASPPSAPIAGQESPPEVNAEAGAVNAESEEAEAEAEPTAEEQAAWSAGEKRIHGALVKERQARKTAREENKALKERLEALETRINPTAVAPDAPATPPAAEAVPAPIAPSVTGSLAACRTFDQVDAAVMSAIQQKTLATELIMAMSGGDRETVVQRLEAERVTHVEGAPLAEATDAQLRRLLVNAQSGCELTIQQAPQQRRLLERTAISFTEAGKILPGLGKPESAEHKAFAAFVQQNPKVTSLGPNWPEMVAEGIAHRLNRTKTATAQPTTAPNPPTPPAPRSAPGAPRTSVAALPRKSERDEIVERVNNGTATVKDMDRYAALSLGAA